MLKWALVIVDHGSRAEAASEVAQRLAGAVCTELQKIARPPLTVQYAHMELCAPDLRTAVEACVSAGAARVVVVPLFLTPGRHARVDIPRQLDAVRLSHPDVVMELREVLGADPLLVELLVRRAQSPA